MTSLYKMCGGKARYEDKKAAISAINHVMRGHRKNRPDNLRAYPCPNCRGWHLTKQ